MKAGQSGRERLYCCGLCFRRGYRRFLIAATLVVGVLNMPLVVFLALLLFSQGRWSSPCVDLRGVRLFFIGVTVFLLLAMDVPTVFAWRRFRSTVRGRSGGGLVDNPDFEAFKQKTVLVEGL